MRNMFLKVFCFIVFVTAKGFIINNEQNSDLGKFCFIVSLFRTYPFVRND